MYAGVPLEDDVTICSRVPEEGTVSVSVGVPGGALLWCVCGGGRGCIVVVCVEGRECIVVCVDGGGVRSVLSVTLASLWNLMELI